MLWPHPCALPMGTGRWKGVSRRQVALRPLQCASRAGFCDAIAIGDEPIGDTARRGILDIEEG